MLAGGQVFAEEGARLLAAKVVDSQPGGTGFET